MRLNATQRDFMTRQLKVTPRVKKFFEWRTDDQVTDDNISSALDDYLLREAKVLEDLGKLEKIAGTVEIVARFENEIQQIQDRVRAADKRNEGPTVLKQAYKDLDSIKTRVAKDLEIGTATPAYLPLREEVEKALAALPSHRQHAHVKTLVDRAQLRHDDAVKSNSNRRHPEALASMQLAKTDCDDATTRADGYDAYRIARAPAWGILKNLENRYANKAIWNGFNVQFTAADNKASLAVHKYVEATNDVKQILTAMGTQAETWHKASLTNNVNLAKAAPQQPEIAAEVKQLEDWLAAVPGLVGSERWTELDLIAGSATELRVAAVERATRLEAFVAARKKASDAIQALRAEATLAAQLDLLALRLSGEADPLATRQAMRFEEGMAVCQQVEKACDALAPTAKAARKFRDDQAALGLRLDTLGKLPVAGLLADELQALTALQAGAEGCGKLTPPDWTGGQAWLDRLNTALAAAEQLAGSLADTAGAKDSARTAGKGEDIVNAVKPLREALAKVTAAPYEKLLEAPGQDIGEACKEAETLAGQGKLDEARMAVAKAADLLASAQRLRARQQLLDEGLAAARKRLDDLSQKSKQGSFKALVPLLVPVTTQIGLADSAVKAGEVSAAGAALVAAEAAARAADQAEAAITDFDRRVADLGRLLTPLKGGGAAVGPAEKALADAAKALEGLKFDEAARLHDEAHALLAGLDISRLAKANRNDPNIVTTAQALLKLPEGARQLDEFVKTLNAEQDFDLIAALAKERFGIVLTSDAGAKTLSAKALWEVMAQVPASHATHSPSLKKVVREKPASSSGSFNWVSKTVNMNGRPDNGKTENFDAATRKKALGIEPDHDNDNDPYAPVDDTPANLFNMTMLHEIGHAVDDRLAFMRGKQGQAAFGGWESHTDLGVIADTVAVAKKFDRDYVLAMLNGHAAEVPLMTNGYAGGQKAWDKQKLAVDEWIKVAKGGRLWWDHALSTQAAIDGKVYQEAYPGQWYSYLLAERTKGVTAYQWRAPGEWFAEVYMCWFGKKLKPNHPFAAWLKAL